MEKKNYKKPSIVLFQEMDEDLMIRESTWEQLGKENNFFEEENGSDFNDGLRYTLPSNGGDVWEEEEEYDS